MSLWGRFAVAYRARPRIWTFNLAMAVVVLAILVYAMFQGEESAGHAVGEEIEYVVVLDLGHGGRDPGAVVKNIRTPDGDRVTVYEHGMIFDVGAHLMELLEAHKNIAVVPTVTDEAIELRTTQLTIPLPPPRTYLRTEPQCDLDEVSSWVSVNLRWMLANYLQYKAREGGGVRRVVFVSLHMDEVSWSKGGLTVYLPPGPYERHFPEDLKPFMRYFEAREWFRVMHSHEADSLDASLSLELAQNIVANFKRHRLRVCEDKTYRTVIARTRTNHYVPAVIRYNAIETRVLLELANLADPVDQQRVLEPLYRERMAWAIYEAILEAFRKPAS